jgi:neutral trehalase
MSHDEKASAPRRFLIDVEETIRVVLEQEDTDGDFQISITDAGPKLMALGTATSNGFKSFDIRVSAPPVFIITRSILNWPRELTCFLTSSKNSLSHAITIASASSSTKPA